MARETIFSILLDRRSTCLICLKDTSLKDTSSDTASAISHRRSTSLSIVHSKLLRFLSRSSSRMQMMLSAVASRHLHRTNPVLESQHHNSGAKLYSFWLRVRLSASAATAYGKNAPLKQCTDPTSKEGKKEKISCERALRAFESSKASIGVEKESPKWFCPSRKKYIINQAFWNWDETFADVYRELLRNTSVFR